MWLVILELDETISTQTSSTWYWGGFQGLRARFEVFLLDNTIQVWYQQSTPNKHLNLYSMISLNQTIDCGLFLFYFREREEKRGGLWSAGLVLSNLIWSECKNIVSFYWVLTEIIYSQHLPRRNDKTRHKVGFSTLSQC